MPRILDSASLHPGYLTFPLTYVVFAPMTLTFELGANFRFPTSLRCQPYLSGRCKREENTQSLSKFAQSMSKCYGPAMPFERPVVGDMVRALQRTPPPLQVLVGPRQVGKTTAAGQVEQHLG